MGGDYRQKRPSPSYFSGASCMSPSCVPVHEEYTRIDAACHRRSRRLRKLIKKIMAESKSIYAGPKPLTFQYDAISYAQNFDDGSHLDEYPRCQNVALPEEQRWQHHVPR